eukprot:4132946-Prymnesium_polylepis.1
MESRRKSGPAKKDAKRCSASGSCEWCTAKWKPVASIPVNAFDEPPFFLRVHGARACGSQGAT